MSSNQQYLKEVSFKYDIPGGRYDKGTLIVSTKDNVPVGFKVDGNLRASQMAPLIELLKAWCIEIPPPQGK